MSTALREEIERLYYDSSKHAVYQSLPEFVEQALGLKIELNHAWRSDRPRYSYLANRLSFAGKRVLDIGANIGYFTLNLAKTYGASVVAYEANPNHARIITEVAEAFGITGVSVKAEGLGLDNLASVSPCDIALFSNVAHHAGHDFDRAHVPSREALPGHMIAYLRALSARANVLFFQMGYNWGGDKKTPIVAVADNPGKLRFTIDALESGGWAISSVAMAHRRGDEIQYVEVDWSRILARAASGSDQPIPPDSLVALCSAGLSQDGMSEFYRRPLFICERRAP